MLHVNDSKNPLNAVDNCAICTIAGLHGITYRDFLKNIRKKDDDFIIGDESFVAMYFATLSTNQDLNKIDPKKALAHQVKGMIKYLTQTDKNNIETHGSISRPLNTAAMMNAVNELPQGSKIAVLIGDSTPFAAGAHWLACQKEADGCYFYDYQLDVTDDMKNNRTFKVHLFKANRFAPLGEVSRTDSPMRPWATKAYRDDCFVLISFMS